MSVFDCFVSWLLRAIFLAFSVGAMWLAVAAPWLDSHGRLR